MKREIQNSLGAKYNTDETKLKKPPVIIANLSLGKTEEDLTLALKNQNDDIQNGGDAIVRILKKDKSGKSNYAVVECNGLFLRLAQLKKVNIK
ncbi:hypothetical protein HHI36_023815 [Cryptolaemus montrouzieri]|uniref:Uncharacterized protein n=1 Tax=Cryptolaemus montrouzieri TaxID=559131 RepID=A0ABD2PHP3_9CUCU